MNILQKLLNAYPACLICCAILFTISSAHAQSVYIDQLGSASGDDWQVDERIYELAPAQNDTRDAEVSERQKESGALFRERSDRNDLSAGFANPELLSNDQAGALSSLQPATTQTNSQTVPTINADSISIDPITGSINLGLPGGGTLNIPTN